MASRITAQDCDFQVSRFAFLCTLKCAQFSVYGVWCSTGCWTARARSVSCASFTEHTASLDKLAQDHLSFFGECFFRNRGKRVSGGSGASHSQIQSFSTKLTYRVSRQYPLLGDKHKFESFRSTGQLSKSASKTHLSTMFDKSYGRSFQDVIGNGTVSSETCRKLVVVDKHVRSTTTLSCLMNVTMWKKSVLILVLPIKSSIFTGL